MSFDPFGQGPQPQPGPGGDPPPGDISAARERALLPAILLLAVALFNLLAALYAGFEATRTALTPAQKLFETNQENMTRVGEMFPNLKKPLEEAMDKQTPEGLKSQILTQFGGATAVLGVASLLILIGGVRMIQLRSYGLCVFASVLAAIPCISMPACCCFGEVAGIWSLVVLLMPDVREAFR